MVEATTADDDILTMLSQSGRDWAAGEYPVMPDHDLAPGESRRRWQAMAELGWTGLSVPEAHDGLGLGITAHARLAEALGRELVSSPLMATGLLAVEALKGQPQADDILPGLVTGEVIIALALEDGAHHAGPLQATAQKTDSGWHLSARKRFVIEGAEADYVLVSAMARSPELFLVPRDQCQIEVLDTIDGRSMAHVTIVADLPPSARLEGGQALIERLGDLARLYLAAEMLGAGQRVFEITLDYLKTREQFGRPIGSFQALQHRAALILIDLELARAALEQGLTVAEEGAGSLKGPAALAKYMAGEVLHRATSETVQMHGGIGMTAEHVAGRYLKWARVSEALFGSAPWLAGRYADAHDF